MDIDWSNPASQVSQWFTVKECIWLPKWDRLASESYINDGLTEDVKFALYALCNQMDHIRNFIEAPLIVHCTFRTVQYNQLVGGAEHSSHIKGEAMDWHAEGLDCDKVRELLIPSLESLGMRMEDRPGSNWIHTDISKVISHRFFKP